MIWPGGTMKKREWLSMILLAVTVAAAILIGTKTIYLGGIDGSRLVQPQTKQLLFEVAVLFVAAAGIFYRVKKRSVRVGLLVFEASVFAWLHQVLLPIVVSGLYLMVILRVGCGIRNWLDRKQESSDWKLWECVMADVTLGAVALILLYCLMSLAGIGSISATRIAAIGIGICTFLPFWPGSDARKAYRTAWTEQVENGENDKKGEMMQTISAGTALMYAFLFAMIFLQVGRMNICADYDSLHYGLRSEYILNDGGGIYENLGSINVVYTYSKGLETLLLPISGLPSFSFFLSFQMWMTFGILVAAGEIVRLFSGRCRWMPTLCMTLLASIPGIMNMGITAKTDSATALFQLIMVYYLLQFVKHQKTEELALAGNAFLLTMVLKPTSLAFSTILAGTAFVYLFVTRSFRVQVKNRFLLSWIPAIAMWLLIWLRTLMLTGLPVTSVFTSIWTKLGFTVKYPFKFDSMPSNGGGGLKAAVKHFLKRLYGVLLAPVGEDMAHVRIAWGTSLLLIFLVIFLIAFLARTKEVEKSERRPLTCLAWMFVTNGMLSLLALYLLWQVDGNYFILLYCLFAILAVIVIGKLESRRLQCAVIALLIPMLGFNVTMTASSNWSGTLGLSPIRVVHKGYYDHWAEAKEDMIRKGNEEIWEILAEDPETRVLVYGTQPEMLMFPCNAQSYTDIEGSGGNYYVSASAKGLADFFTYAEMDYVYLCGGYLKPGTEAWNFVVELIELGYLTDIFYENGNALARFTTEPAAPEHVAEVLKTFAQCYWPGEQQ